jgi:hypothetical protein
MNAEREETTMRSTIGVVDFDTGLIARTSGETMTSDVPPDIAERATEASLDESGRLHYAGLDGHVHVCEVTTRKLGERQPSDYCFLWPATAGSDRNGRCVLHLCVIEPGPDGRESRQPPDR